MRLVGRSRRIDAEEFYRPLDGVVIDNTELLSDKLIEWETPFLWEQTDPIAANYVQRITAATNDRPRHHRRLPTASDKCVAHGVSGTRQRAVAQRRQRLGAILHAAQDDGLIDPDEDLGSRSRC